MPKCINKMHLVSKHKRNGSDEWTRTTDPRLMSLACDANANDFTKVYELALVRYRQHMIGGIAVICSRQFANED